MKCSLRAAFLLHRERQGSYQSGAGVVVQGGAGIVAQDSLVAGHGSSTSWCKDRGTGKCRGSDTVWCRGGGVSGSIGHYRVL